MIQLKPAVNSGDNIFGNPNALLELVEYGDYECPHCGRAYPIIKEIKHRLANELKFVFRNFPLSNIHPNAFSAAVATEAAARQGKFWEMHNIIFENQKTLAPDDILLFATTIGLDPQRFKNDIEQTELIVKVERDFESGMRSGVNGTPSFFVNGKRFNGDWSSNQLPDYLEQELEQVSLSKK